MEQQGARQGRVASAANTQRGREVRAPLAPAALSGESHWTARSFVPSVVRQAPRARPGPLGRLALLEPRESPVSRALSVIPGRQGLPVLLGRPERPERPERPAPQATRVLQGPRESLGLSARSDPLGSRAHQAFRVSWARLERRARLASRAPLVRLGSRERRALPARPDPRAPGRPASPARLGPPARLAPQVRPASPAPPVVLARQVRLVPPARLARPGPPARMGPASGSSAPCLMSARCRRLGPLVTPI